MNGLLIMVSLTAPTVDYGWQQTPDGLEYIIQIEAPVVQSLREGEEVYSLVPEDKRNLSRVRIHLGEGTLTQADVAATTGVPGVEYGYQPLSSGGLDFIVQLPPAAVQAFLQGKDAIVPIPELVRDIRRFRVRVGVDQLPRLLGLPTPAAPGGNPAAGGNPVAGGASGLGGQRPGGIGDPAPVPPLTVTGGQDRSLLAPRGQGRGPAAGYNAGAGVPNTPPPNYGAVGGNGQGGNPGYGLPAVGGGANPGLPPDGGWQNYGAGNGAGSPQPSYPPGNVPAAPQWNYGQQPGAPSAPAVQPPANYGGNPMAPVQPAAPAVQPAVPNQNLPPRVALGGAPPASDTSNVQRTGYQAPAENEAPAAAARTAANNGASLAAPPQPEQRWMTLLATTVLFFVSLGLNFFLGWHIMGLNDRYRRMMADFREQSRRAARA